MFRAYTSVRSKSKRSDLAKVFRPYLSVLSMSKCCELDQVFRANPSTLILVKCSYCFYINETLVCTHYTTLLLGPPGSKECCQSHPYICWCVRTGLSNTGVISTRLCRVLAVGIYSWSWLQSAHYSDGRSPSDELASSKHNDLDDVHDLIWWMRRHWMIHHWMWPWNICRLEDLVCSGTICHHCWCIVVLPSSSDSGFISQSTITTRIHLYPRPHDAVRTARRRIDVGLDINMLL